MLILDTYHEVVAENCTTCHSEDLITQQRLSRKNWDSLILWMEQKQQMPPLDEITKKQILDYLSKNYSDKDEKSDMNFRTIVNPLP